MGSYFQLKYAVALIAAFSIDALQFLLGVVIAAAFFHPATALAILGCVAAETSQIASCWVGGLFGAVVGGVASFIPVIGPALIAFTDAVGAGLAALVDFCLTCVGYGIIIPMLIFTGIVQPNNFFRSWRRTPTLILKIIPGIDMLPFFTGMVLMSIIETEMLKKKESLSYIARVRLAGQRVASNQKGASAGYRRENLNARYAQDQVAALRGRYLGRREREPADEERPAHVPLVDRIQSAGENPDSLLAQNQRSAAASRQNDRPQAAPSPHVLNLAA